MWCEVAGWGSQEPSQEQNAFDESDWFSQLFDLPDARDNGFSVRSGKGSGNELKRGQLKIITEAECQETSFDILLYKIVLTPTLSAGIHEFHLVRACFELSAL